MNPTIAGIHHVTAITGDAQRNLDFYCDLLGLRLVKLTVNFDDPGSYHFYYGDELGRPGTILTFFAWPGGQPGALARRRPAPPASPCPLARSTSGKRGWPPETSAPNFRRRGSASPC